MSAGGQRTSTRSRRSSRPGALPRRVATQRSTPRPDADRASTRRRALLILPGLAVVVLLFLYPLATLVLTSVYGDGGWTLQHYRRPFPLPPHLNLLPNTIQPPRPPPPL